MRVFLIILVLLTCSLLSSRGQTFQNTTGGAIANGFFTTTTFDINVAGLPSTIDGNFGIESVCLDLAWEELSTLNIYLISPDGTRVRFVRSAFNSNPTTGFTNTCFNETGTDGYLSGTDPFTGTFLPYQVFYIMNNGQDPNGTWQLEIQDFWGADNPGMLNSVSITFVNSPTIPQIQQDCNNAIPVCTGYYEENQSYRGPGYNYNEIPATCLSEGENHSVWYTFVVESDGDLEFSITPTNPSDYDWAVFDITNANCSDLVNNESLRISCNYDGGTGVTGALGTGAIGSENLIPATQGQKIAVVIDNFSGNFNGYRLDFTQSSAGFVDATAPELDSIGNVLSCGIDTVTFAFSEDVPCGNITDSHFLLNGPGGSHTISNIRGINCVAGGNYEKTFTFDVNPPLSVLGTYTLSVNPAAPAITDNCGNPIDLTGVGASLDFQLEPMSVVKDSTMVTCNGFADGIAEIVNTSGQAPLTYSWNDPGSQTSAIANNLAPGTYTVNITDAIGCIASTDIEITEPAVLAVTTSDTDQSCFGVCDGTSFATPTGGTTPYSYLWTNSLSTTTAQVTSLCQGSYNVNVTDANGCTAISTATIAEPAPITIDTTITQSVCNQFVGSIQLTINGGSSPFSYAWTNDFNGSLIGGNSNIITGLGTGDYSVTVTDANGCTATEPAIPIISLYEHNLTITWNNDVSCYGVCDGGAAASITGYGSDFRYFWFNQTTNSLDPNIIDATRNDLCAGTYEVTSVEQVTGCESVASVTIATPDQIVITSSPDTSICLNDCPTLSASVAGGTGTTIQWTNQSQTDNYGSASTFTPSPCPTTSTTYTVLATDVNGCSNFVDIDVTILPNLTLALTANRNPICEGDSIVITASGLGGNNDYIYDFNGSPTTSPIFIDYPTDTTTYTVGLSATCGADPTDNEITINVRPLPIIDLTTGPEGCPPYDMDFFSIMDPEPISYSINYGDGRDTSFATFGDTLTHTYTEPGIYDIRFSVMSPEGCVKDSTMYEFLEVHDNPIAQFYVSQDTITDVLSEICLFDQSMHHDSVAWYLYNADSPDNLIGNEFYQCGPLDSLDCYDVILTIQNLYGCVDTTSRNICYTEQSSVFIPTVFTPNGDGFNDCFRPYIRGESAQTNYSLQIFDRWGSVAFETQDILDCWNGAKNSGKPQVGVYVYVLSYVDNRGKLITRQGSVAIAP